MATALTGGMKMQKKRIYVSQKRQITIPIDFFNSVGIDREVECYVQNNSIVIKPIRDVSGEFDEEILADLIAEGFSGEELLAKFRETRRQIRPAVEKMLAESKRIASGDAPYATLKDIFGEEA